MAKDKPICCIALFLIASWLHCCKSPASQEEEEKMAASIEITSEVEPMLGLFNWDTSLHCFNNRVTIHEMAGVGCNISNVELSFVSQDNAYESHALWSGRLNAHGTMDVNISNICADKIYEKIRIKVSGQDDNNHSISAQKDFLIEFIPNLQGIYKGPIKGKQNGVSLSMTVTFQIMQEGKSANGTWVTNKGTSGSFNGSLTGIEFSADITQNEPCYGLFKATGEIKDYGLSIKGTYTGTSCYGDVDATFTVYRQ